MKPNNKLSPHYYGNGMYGFYDSNGKYILRNLRKEAFKKNKSNDYEMLKKAREALKNESR